mmetsp:Transcript_37807/g.87649  ORF Transcript_37807/g.87649 Transcript_37807/m.87649 type:complete len:207 (+) Transcript_37807:443-1063(+)
MGGNSSNPCSDSDNQEAQSFNNMVTIAPFSTGSSYSPNASTSLCFLEHRSHLSQIVPNNCLTWSSGPIIKVVPESGNMLHAVSWSFFISSLEQSFKCCMASPSPTEMPRRSTPQWYVPTEANLSSALAPPILRTPPVWSPKHMEKRDVPDCSMKPEACGMWVRSSSTVIAASLSSACRACLGIAVPATIAAPAPALLPSPSRRCRP